MSARKFDNALRWMVESHSRPGIEHLVEIDAYGGAGRCECEHFQFRLEPMLKAGAKPSNSVRCVHILEARDQFIDDFMNMIKARQKENGHARKHAYHNE